MTYTLSMLNFDTLEVDIVSTKIRPSIFTDGLRALGVNFIELSGKPRSFKNHRMFAKLLKEKKYDIVHFNLFHSFALYYVRQARILGVPIRLAHAHNTALRQSPTKWLKLIIHSLARKIWNREMTHTLSCSEAAARFIFGISADEIIKNGIHPENFLYSPEDRKRVRAELGVADGVPIVGHVGRLCWQKNQKFLLSMHKELIRRLPEAKLLLVGDGDTLDDLKERAKVLGIENSVCFYGVSKTIPALMSAMDVFVFPSNMEGLGIVAIEAQASGLPTINSDRVPPEAFVTPLAISLSLRAGAATCALTPNTLSARIWGLILRRSRVLKNRPSPRAEISLYSKARQCLQQSADGEKPNQLS